MKIEFNRGETVHFRPYIERKPIAARVLSFDAYGDRIEYRLEGVEQPLTSITTGKSIVESEMFDPISEKDAFKY